MDDGVFHQVSNETLDVMYKRSSKPYGENTQVVNYKARDLEFVGVL